jgi:hypothetical protein
MYSILCWILSIWEALDCIFLHFGLDPCIVNKGEKFELVVGYWTHLECFQVVSSLFLALLHTGLTSRGHRSDRSECWSCTRVGHRSDRSVLSWCSCSVFFKWFACIRPGGAALFQGSLHVCRGSSLWFSSFGLVVCALCFSIVLSRMCRAVALA